MEGEAKIARSSSREVLPRWALMEGAYGDRRGSGSGLAVPSSALARPGAETEGFGQSEEGEANRLRPHQASAVELGDGLGHLGSGSAKTIREILNTCPFVVLSGVEEGDEDSFVQCVHVRVLNGPLKPCLVFVQKILNGRAVPLGCVREGFRL
jgi:hypothetical protein